MDIRSLYKGINAIRIFRCYMQAMKMKNTMESVEKRQKRATKYYDRFSKVYDWLSSDRYYKNPRTFAIKKLDLKPNQNILNIPCGTGQNFKYFQEHLKDTGKIIGIDLSRGMLSKANEKIQANEWNNLKVFCGNATKIDRDWVNRNIEQGLKFDSILCDLGLSGFPE